MIKARISIVMGLMLLNGIGIAGDTWPSFRGPTGDGTVTGSKIPLTWSETNNVRWKIALPLAGWSTPVIQDNQIWATGATEKGSNFFAYCVALETGKVLFEKQLFTCAKPEPLMNAVNGYASPSGAIEKGRVYLHFGSYGTACLDTGTGEVLWKRDDLKCRHFRGPGSSPILYKNLLILTFDGIDQQYVVALDKLTGKTVWKSDRNIKFNDLNEKGEPKGEGDFRKGFATPYIMTVNGKDQMITPASTTIISLDPETGKELWRVRSPTHTPAVSAVSENGIAFAVTGHGPAEMLAINSVGRGDLTDTHVLWRMGGKDIPVTPSPIVIKGLLYMLADHGILNCLDVVTGKVIWRESLGGNFIASPIHDGEKIYCPSLSGKTLVLRAGRTFEKLAENRLDTGFMASPAVSGNTLILRTKTHLYAIEAK
jgi:outer membrane protein assembly factor BamB